MAENESENCDRCEISDICDTYDICDMCEFDYISGIYHMYEICMP